LLPQEPEAAVAERLGWAIAISTLLLILGGCSSWPEEGSGGLAERLPRTEPRLAFLDTRMQQAKANGARSYAAALTAETDLWIVRAHREWAAGQRAEAQMTMEEAEVLLDMIAVRMAQAGSGANPSRSGRR
jgi:hypothetical protein